jgi:hypothetical protein
MFLNPPPPQVLWDCCVLCPGFPFLAEAVMLILDHASDSEDSVRKLASSLCTELWFSSNSMLGEEGGLVWSRPGAPHCGFAQQ